MHRLILSSSTYRQSSSYQDAIVSNPKSQIPNPKSIDPQNRLLWHFPRTRLEAELIRDAALRASGLLTEKIGGESVFPPQPPEITSEGAYGPLKWTVSSGEDRYRRGLYTFAKRTAPYAMFATFDGPSGEACLARREVTNTPLQALTLLNNDSLLEAARSLGRLAASLPLPLRDDRGEGASARINVLFRRCLSRPPTSDEQTRLIEFYHVQKERLIAGDLDAAKIAGPSEGNIAEIAAWTLVARAILNLDEFITKE